MKYELLVNNEFEKDLYKELNKCKKRVLMQFMTFEGDKTGLKLADKLKLLKKKGVDVIVLIDRFTDYYVSDTYHTKKKVRKEVISTKKMISDMKNAGIKLKRTRPAGHFWIHFLMRNHKKIVIIDDLFYFGGMNISDHNFDWNDFMVKVTDNDLLPAVIGDFCYTFKGGERHYQYKNILTNKYLEKTYYDLIKNAKKEIIISSPYILDCSLINLLNNMKIDRVLLTLKENNYWIINSMADYLSMNLIKIGVEVYWYNNFSHAKFMIIDREILLVGSSNMGKESFLTKEEIGILIDDKDFVRYFTKRMYLDEKDKIKKATFRNKISVIQPVLTYLFYKLLIVYAKVCRKSVKPIG